MTTQSKRGFSLIEVLVVVSIIALLIAILLPALSMVRRSAEDAQCMSNMSQLMKAQLAYVTDHDSYFPHHQEWIWGKDSLPDGTDFRQYARDYTTRESPREGTLNSYITDFNVHFCPIASEMPVNALKSLTRNGPPAVALGDTVLRSYVQNGGVAGNEDGYVLETINKPAELLFLGEENTFSSELPGKSARDHPMNDGKLDRTWDSLGTMHRRRDWDNLRSGYSTAAFVDGHVDWVFPHAKNNNIWATEAFMTDNIPNPTEPDPSMISNSFDFSTTTY